MINIFRELARSREIRFALVFLAGLLLSPVLLYAQGGALQTQILETISRLVSVINVLLIGVVVWAGFLIARGDGTGIQKLTYSVIGLVVVNSARYIIQFFTP
jgi:hypothetical protein